ncbi:MAG: hypothetical protein NVS4B7_06820 [Ktedonobacteraceae bacterium]
MKKLLIIALVLCWFLSGISLNLGGGNTLKRLLTLNSSIGTAYAQSYTQHRKLNASVMQTPCQGLQDQLTQLQQALQLSVERRRVSLDQGNQADIASTIANLSRQTEQAQEKLAACLKTNISLTAQPKCQRLLNQFVQLRQALQVALERRKVVLNLDLDQSDAGAINATVQGYHQQIDLVQGELNACLTAHSSTNV